MGCVASKLEEEEEVVSICRERKRQLKLAVDRRYALADAHFRYCQALFGVSAAINLFVARHSSPGSSFLITFPPPSPPKENNVVSNPLFIQQSTSSEPVQTAIDCESTTTSDFSEEERVEQQACLYQNAMREQQQACMYQKVEREEQPCMYQKQEEKYCGYFYMGMPPSTPSPQRDFGWDFFDPFAGMRPAVISGYSRNSDDDLRVVREEEGIPELEEEEEEEEQVGDRFDGKNNVAVTENTINVKHEKAEVEEIIKAVDLDSNMTQPGDQQKGLTVIDTPVRGRELLEALKDIEDHFLRAYESGKEVSKMLEANRVHLQSNLEEIKEKSAKLIQDITLRSSSSRSSSCKSLAISNSKNSSPWTEFKNDLFDDYGGMDSGSHSLTLGRLYAWEKKLYEDVKDGDSIRKIYEKKCNQLRDQDARGNEGQTVDKTRAAVKDLYSRILVAIRSAESISSRIEKLRDEELQPQIIELLQGMMNTWKIMMECHEIQNKIMFEVKTFTCPSYGKFSNTHLLATLQLRAELQNWHTCFKEYMLAQKAYIEALHGWLSKFVVAEVEFYSNRRGSSPPSGTNGPQLLLICNNWLTLLQKLPDKMVGYAIKSFAKDVKALCNQQEEEQQQKRKVDGLSKVLDKKLLTLQKTENKIFRPKHFDHNPELDTESQNEYLRDRKDLLDDFKVKVEIEKEKHQNSMQETQRITLNGFQTGFCRVFESLTDFSKASLKMYQDLISYKERAQNIENPSCIETSHVEDGIR